MTGQEGPGLLHMSAAKTHAASAVMQSRTRQATTSAMPIAVCGITTFRGFNDGHHNFGFDCYFTKYKKDQKQKGEQQ